MIVKGINCRPATTRSAARLSNQGEEAFKNVWTQPSYYSRSTGFRRPPQTYERQPELLRMGKGAVGSTLGASLLLALGMKPALGVLGGIAGLFAGYSFWGGDRPLAKGA
jgi:hypothetical protein